MAGEQDNKQDMADLLGWLEDERTKDLVDLINRAAKGEPVEEAAERYKARYRHSGSMDRLSDMFDSLQEQHDAQAGVELGGMLRQLRASLAEIESQRRGFKRLSQEKPESCRHEGERLQELLAVLDETATALAEFRGAILALSAADPQEKRERLRIIGL
ncbi:MAG: hypothetical protein R3F46_05380 [bacterium]